MAHATAPGVGVQGSADPATSTRLMRSGLRVTRQRVAVLDAVQAGEHLDVDTIAERARADLGRVSTQAVYDVLRVLDRAGLLRRIEPAGKPALYEIRVGDNHHHVICRSCGTVSDVDCVVGAAPCLDAADASGFQIDEAEVVFWGTCPECTTSGEALPRRDSSEFHAEEAAV